MDSSLMPLKNNLKPYFLVNFHFFVKVPIMYIQTIIDKLNDLPLETMLREEHVTDIFGQDVCYAISGDLNHLVVGYSKAENNTGIVFLMIKENEKWVIKQTLFGKEKGIGSKFGESVAISNDGKKIVVGAYNQTVMKKSRVGVVYIFEECDDMWHRQTLLPPLDEVGMLFGFSVSMSGDGSRIVVGTPGCNNYSGKVFIFTKNGEGYEVQELLPESKTRPVTFGNSVSISMSGRLICVGVPGDFSERGEVYCYKLNNDKWNLIQVLEKEGFFFGERVKIITDTSNFKVVLKVFDDNNAKTRYEFQAGKWELETPIVSSEGATYLEEMQVKYNLTEEENKYLKQLDIQEERLLKQLKDIKNVKDKILARVLNNG